MVTQLCMCIHILFYTLLHYGLSEDIRYSFLYRRTLFIHPIDNSLHLLTPDSQSCALWQAQVCSPCPWFCVCFICRFIRVIFEILRTNGSMRCLSFWLISLRYDRLWLHPCGYRWHDLVLVCGWEVVHCIYVPHHFYLSVMDIEVVSMFWPLWIVLLWGQGCMYFFELEFCPNTCPRVGLLYPLVILFSLFWRASTLFSTVAAPTHIPADAVAGLPFLHTFSTTGSL